MAGTPIASIWSEGVKDSKQLFRNHTEESQAGQHQKSGGDCAETDGAVDPQPLPGAVVIGDNGHHSVVQAENRHKDKAVQLEINSENRRGSRGKPQKNQIHAKGHDRADALHNDRRNSDFIDFTGQGGAQAESVEIQANFPVQLQIEKKSQKEAAELTDYSSRGGSRHAHFRGSEISKDQDGIQNDIDHGPQPLGKHGEQGAAGGGQQALHGNLQKDSETEGTGRCACK